MHLVQQTDFPQVAMSSVPSLSLPPALPLDIILFISGVKYLLNEIIVSAAWLGVMVPLFCVLFAASSPALRRKPIFIFNAISVSTGIIMGITNVVFLTRIFEDPINGVSRGAVIFYVTMVVSVEVFIDSILLFRVYSVFPLRTTGKHVLLWIYGPLLLLKTARVTNLIIFLVQFSTQIDGVSFQSLASFALRFSVAKVGWALQLVDNAACSALFLWKLYSGRTLSENADSSTDGQGHFYVTRLKMLFWIAASNFVFPAFFDIVLLVSSSTGFKGTVANNILLVLITNVYVEIIGVLFATIWIVSHRPDDDKPLSSQAPGASLVRFASNPQETSFVQFASNPDLTVFGSRGKSEDATIGGTTERP